MGTTIVLADDHKIVRDGLRSLLERKPAFKVIGEASNGREAIRLIEALKPDLLIVDIGMPDLNGVEATKQLKARWPQVKVLTLSMQSDKRFVSRMLSAGASGYLLKDCAFEELTHAIDTVMNGQVYLSLAITSQVVTDYVRNLSSHASEQTSALTQRECEVIQLLAEGKSTKVIASNLSISVKTVETHRSHVMQKLGISSIAELTKFAIREGFTTLEL